MKKQKSELWDKMHYMFRGYNDRMVHASFTYDYMIDARILGLAIKQVMIENPILHSSFYGNLINPYWLEKDFSINEVLTVETNPDCLKKAVEEFLLNYIHYHSHIQLKVKLFYHDGKSTLCFLTNHMCMDGSGFIYLVSCICEAYNKIAENPEYESPKLNRGDRSHKAIYSHMEPQKKKKAKNLFINPSKSYKHKLPYSEKSKDDKPFICMHKISEEKLLKLKDASKQLEVTINDIICAAFIQSLYELDGFNKNEQVNVSCAMDLRRRYLNTTEHIGITNHTAFFNCHLNKKADSMVEALKEVHELNIKNKDDEFLGLYGLPLLNLAYTIMPYCVAEKIIKIGYANPFIAISNVGVIDEKSFKIKGNAPVEGFITGSVKYKPFTLMSATTFCGEMTLAFCERGNSVDKALLEHFFDIFDSNLDKLISETSHKEA